VLNLDANDSALHGDEAVTITVMPGNTAPTVSAGASQQIQLPTNSASLSGTVSDDGLPVNSTTTCTWSKDSGPGTVTFANANAAATTATFSTVGTYVLRLTASDTALQAYDTLTVTVVAAGGWSIRTQAEDFDNGGQYVAYYDTTASNAGGANYRPGEYVDIRTTTDDPNGYAVCYIAGGEWMKYTVNIPSSGLCSVKFRTSSTTDYIGVPTTNALHLYCDGNDLTSSGVNLPATNGPEIWTTTTVSNISLPAGQHVLTIEIYNGSNSWDLNWFEIDSASGTGNTAPTVAVGSNQQISWPTNTVSLSGTVSDDGLPSGSSTTCTWSKNSGVGNVTFTNANAAATTATFSTTGTYVLRLTATDTALSAYASVTIAVIPTNTAPTVVAGPDQMITLPNNTASLTGTVSDDGLPVGSATTCTWSKDSGPGTVSFGNANAAATTATFSTVGTYILRLTASDTALSAHSTLQVVVNASGSGWSLRIQAEDYDTGGQGVAYYDTTTGNGGGAYRTDDVDIRTTTDDANGYAICYISSGEWMNYTRTIPTSGSYNVKFRTSSTADYSFVATTDALHLFCDGTDVTPNGVDLPGTVGPEYWATTTVSNVNLPAGQHVLKIQVYNGAAWDFNWFEIDAQ
jgi:hypothetical protein